MFHPSIAQPKVADPSPVGPSQTLTAIRVQPVVHTYGPLPASGGANAFDAHPMLPLAPTSPAQQTSPDTTEIAHPPVLPGNFSLWYVSALREASTTGDSLPLAELSGVDCTGCNELLQQFAQPDHTAQVSLTSLTSGNHTQTFEVEIRRGDGPPQRLIINAEITGEMWEATSLESL